MRRFAGHGCSACVFFAIGIKETNDVYFLATRLSRDAEIGELLELKQLCKKFIIDSPKYTYVSDNFFICRYL
jgi:hypothetical protein